MSVSETPKRVTVRLFGGIGGFVLLSVVLGCPALGWASPQTFHFVSFDFTDSISGSNSTIALGINDAGQIVGEFNDTSNVTHGFLRDTGGAFHRIDVPTSFQATSTNAFGINSSGLIVGNYTSNNVTHGYLKDTGGTFLPINVTNSTSTFTGGINNAGEIVGTFVDMAGKTHGYLRDTGGTFHTIDVPSIPPFNSTLTEANGINLGAGQQIVGDYVDNSSTPKTHGYLKNGTIFTTIDFPNVPFTELYGITNAGKIVGIYEANNATHGFLTTDMGLTFTQIDFSNSTLKTFANDINNADRIVGSYRDNPTADLFHGYFADPVPEPSTLALVAAGMASFALRRLRRKAGV